MYAVNAQSLPSSSGAREEEQQAGNGDKEVCSVAGKLTHNFVVGVDLHAGAAPPPRGGRGVI